MEFDEVIRRQRMTRRFERTPIDRALLDSILSTARKAPTAGNTQGISLILLEGERTEIFWRCADPFARRPAEARAPVIVVPGYNKKAYLQRYAEPDKAATGLKDESKWPMAFWVVDAAFAAMTVMLSTTAAGLGCWFFGIFTGKDELLEALGVQDFEPIGALAIGYPASRQVKSPSLRRERKPLDQLVIRP